METEPPEISVLCVDDEPGMGELVGTFLSRADDGLTVTTAESATEALESHDIGSFDCIISDYDMPETDGLAFLNLVRADHPDLPFILYTGRGSEEIASEAISAGVTDYMQKESGSEQYELLAQRVRNAVSRRRLSRDAATAKEHAEIILEASPNAVLVSVEGKCVYVNPAAEQLLAPLTKTEIVDTSIHEFLHRSDGSELFSAVHQDEGTFEQERFSLGTDEPVPMEGAARRIRWNGGPAVVHVLSDVRERVEYEKELAYRQTLLNATFEASPDGIVVTDTDWNVLTHNDEFVDIWGLQRDVLQTGDGKLAVGALKQSVSNPDAFEERLQQQYDHPEERGHDKVRLTDGRLLDLHSAPVQADDGTLLGFIWFYRDVTSVERLEREQREAFERMTDAVFAVDDNWEFTFLNEQAGDLLDRNPEDLLGTNIWAEFPEAVDTTVYDRYHEAVRTGESTAFDYYFDPLKTEFEVRAFPSDTGLTVYFRDVTDQRQMKSELEVAVETLHRLYEVASDPDRSFEEKQRKLLEVGCSYLDLPHGFVTELSETSQTIVASASENDLLQPGKSCPLGESYCRKTITTDSGLLAIQNAGEEGWVNDPAYERYDLETYLGGKVVVDGELYGTVCFAADEPREKEFSEMEWTFVELLSRWLGYELEHREHNAALEAKNDQLEEFASIVSHDLRNPLSVAEGYLELAREEQRSENLDRVASALTRMDELIEDILTLSREGEIVGEQVKVDLAAVSRDAWSNVEMESATLTVETDMQFVADESRVAQLLENLFRNAIEHGMTGNRPDAADPFTVSVGAFEGGFYVEDNGTGIDPGIQTQLFRRGATTKERGTGIGLRVVGQIVAAHGWKIAATESADGGARFEVTGVDEM